jgi:hypothetical protein
MRSCRSKNIFPAQPGLKLTASLGALSRPARPDSCFSGQGNQQQPENMACFENSLAACAHTAKTKPVHQAKHIQLSTHESMCEAFRKPFGPLMCAAACFE